MCVIHPVSLVYSPEIILPITAYPSFTEAGKGGCGCFARTSSTITDSRASVMDEGRDYTDIHKYSLLLLNPLSCNISKDKCSPNGVWGGSRISPIRLVISTAGSTGVCCSMVCIAWSTGSRG